MINTTTFSTSAFKMLSINNAFVWVVYDLLLLNIKSRNYFNYLFYNVEKTLKHFPANKSQKNKQKSYCSSALNRMQVNHMSNTAYTASCWI